MHTTYKIASSPQIVLANIQHFQSELAQSVDLQDRLAYNRSWYAYRPNSHGEWIFGNSKYIGYSNSIDDRPLKAEEFIKLAEELNGRRTEAQLRRWFTAVEPGTALYEKLSAELFAFLANYGKAPSTMMRLNVLKDAFDEHSADNQDDGRNDPNDAIVELIVAVAETLPTAQFQRLQARLK